jgi:magnesium chelatase family protein
MGTNCKGATRPCNCGYLGHYSGRCRCTPDQILRYRGRISGPLLDRIDLHVEVPALAEADLVASAQSESSRVVRERVTRARAAQLRRQGAPNAHLAGRAVEERARTDAEGRQLLRCAISGFGLSARAHHRVLRIARTVADLEQCADVLSEHVAEALRYRAIPAPN